MAIKRSMFARVQRGRKSGEQVSMGEFQGSESPLCNSVMLNSQDLTFFKTQRTVHDLILMKTIDFCW